MMIERNNKGDRKMTNEETQTAPEFKGITGELLKNILNGAMAIAHFENVTGEGILIDIGKQDSVMIPQYLLYETFGKKYYSLAISYRTSKREAIKRATKAFYNLSN